MTSSAGGADILHGDVMMAAGLCRLSACKSAAVHGTPLCSEHLKQVRSAPTPPGPALQNSGELAPAQGNKERSPAPAQPRNSVLGSSFVMRKSVSNSYMLGPSNAAITVAPTMPRNGFQSLPSNGVNGEHSRWIAPVRGPLIPFSRPPGVQEPPPRKRSIWDFDEDDTIQSNKVATESARPKPPKNGMSTGSRPEHSDAPIERPENLRRAEETRSSVSEEEKLRRKQDLERRRKERDDALQREGGSKGTPTWSLDAYIYAQNEGAEPLPLPPGVVARPSRWPSSTSTSIAFPFSAQRSTVVHAPMDPRVHWTRMRTAAWYEAKQEEIKARGGRKANVRKAAERMAKRRRHANDTRRQDSADNIDNTHNTDDAAGEKRTGLVPRHPSVWEGDLPPEVQSNQAWQRLLRTFAQDELRGTEVQGSRTA